jgi:hypothetical protein
MAAGSCVVLKPSIRAPRTQSVLSRLVLNLDREVFAVTDAKLQDLLKKEWKVIVSTGSGLAFESRAIPCRILELDAGLNVFCHIDPFTTNVSTCANVVSHSMQESSQLWAFDVVIVLQDRLRELQTLVLRDLGGVVRIQEEPVDYLRIARPSSELVFIGVSSTEEALMHLAKLYAQNISLLLLTLLQSVR